MDYSLEFEEPLRNIAKRIGALREKGHLDPVEQECIKQLTHELQRSTREIYAHLTAWQTVQVARHKDRPYAADYIRLICNDFLELSGDRMFGNDRAILAGPGTLDGTTVMFVCHQKGRSRADKQEHNFGMPHPEGYRKAIRLMKQAEKFHFPIICLIDTPGAFPGLEDEERGQSEAIATSLYLMSRLRVPVIAVVIGEGGSGGALALSVANRLLMLEHSIYTVAAPEAAASILWRDTAFAPQAAEAMCISASELFQTQLIDEIISEPSGGAHRDPKASAQHLHVALRKHLADLQKLSAEQLIEKRYQKFRSFGAFASMNMSSLTSNSTDALPGKPAEPG